MSATRPFVVKLGGALLDDGEAFCAISNALAAMHQARPGSVVVVHGGGSAVDRHLARLGFETRKRAGIRITPPDQMTAIASVLGGTVNQQIVGALLGRGIDAVGLDLGDGHTTVAEGLTGLDFDPGCVGAIARGTPRLLETLLGGGFLPVLSSVGFDAEGGLLNVNADDAAAGIAKMLGAAALVYLTDVPGVLGADGSVCQELDAAAIDSLIAAGTITGGMIPKVRGALATAQTVGTPVIIASWRDPSALGDLAAGLRTGTCIVGAALTTPASS